MNRASSFHVITLSGELEYGDREALHDILQVPTHADSALVDCSAVTYADSTALAEFLRFHKEARERNVRIAMLVVLPQFARLIRYAGLQKAFAVFASRGEALTYLADRPT